VHPASKAVASNTESGFLAKETPPPAVDAYKRMIMRVIINEDDSHYTPGSHACK
jgi:hypothetical protein